MMWEDGSPSHGQMLPGVQPLHHSFFTAALYVLLLTGGDGSPLCSGGGGLFNVSPAPRGPCTTSVESPVSNGQSQ